MSNSVYSIIVCPACERSFKFLDNMNHSSPTGQLLTCPRCRTMFAFAVSKPACPDSELVELPSGTAPIDDSDAFNKFVESLNHSSPDLSSTEN